MGMVKGLWRMEGWDEGHGQGGVLGMLRICGREGDLAGLGDLA